MRVTRSHYVHVCACARVRACIDGSSTVSVRVSDNAGYMTKMGAIRKNWKRRWFQLDGEGDGTLTYYADEANQGKTKQGVDEKGRIDMREVKSVQESDSDLQRIIIVTAQRTVRRRRLTSSWMALSLPPSPPTPSPFSLALCVCVCVC